LSFPSVTTFLIEHVICVSCALQATEAKEILAKYDVDRNGLLDKAEVTSILKELALKEAEIQDQMEKAQAAVAPILEKHRGRGPRQNAALDGEAKQGFGGFGGSGTEGLDNAQLRALGSLEQRLEKVEGQVRISKWSSFSFEISGRGFMDCKGGQL
jgi:hypothetical protein